MQSPVPELDINGGKLIAVPAVHYRAVFAYHINIACSHNIERPDAIAVELGQGAVAAVSKWLKELGVAKPGAKLPAMLGLVSRNRRIHPKFREKAIWLQKTYGNLIQELPPEILKKHLEYSTASLLCLSPTDSIIEAIRLALELNIPVYGIDMEESASLNQYKHLIQDPLCASKDFCGYIKRNQQSARVHRDPYINGRRERVMAARLKYLLQRHERIAYTGGLAHWWDIHQLLLDSNLKPATEIPADDGEQYARVLVHPGFAISQMDLFPSISNWYENHRTQINRGLRLDLSEEFLKIYNSHMDAAYSVYFSCQKQRAKTLDQLKDREKLSAFEQFLHKLCVVTQNQLPHFGSILEAAEAMMSGHFMKSLTESLFRHDMDWALPADFPHLPMISPATTSEASSSPLTVPSATLGFPRLERDGNGNIVYDYTDPFYLSDALDNGNPPIDAQAPWFVSDKTSDFLYKTESQLGAHWNWPPCEFLLHGTAYEAAKIIQSNNSGKKIEAFEGTLLDGIDVKSTLRAKIQGQGTLYVYRKRKDKLEDAAVLQGKSLEPTVFIFEDPRKDHKAFWSMGSAGLNNLRDYVESKDIVRFDKITGQFGDVFIGGVYFANEVRPSENLRSIVDIERNLIGYLTFGNPCAHVKQSAMWLEAMDYGVCPVLQDTSFDMLVDYYRMHHGASINRSEWASSLVRFAIPYAKNRVVIVASDGFVLDQIVQQEAHAHQIQLDVLPLSVFPKDRIRQIRRQYFVSAGKSGLSIELEFEQKLGPKDKYLNMLPPQMQAQVMVNQ